MDLSVVVAARNDDYGGNFLPRLGLFAHTLSALAVEYKIDMELIVVEWNPPESEPRLRTAVLWPLSTPVRIITVSNARHELIPGYNRMPMFEYVAKNVGIRRANGTHVLSTNPDIIFGREMAARMAMNSWAPGCFYRANRSDVRGTLENAGSLDDLLSFCASSTYVTYRPQEAQPGMKAPLHTEASGDFLLMARSAWHSMHGYPEYLSHGTIDSYGLALADACGMREIVLEEPIYHLDHDRSQCVGRPVVAWTNELKGKKNPSDWGLGLLDLPEESVDQLEQGPPVIQIPGA